nr:hypothetical protein [uncultured Flavobacterium sp.]
MKQIDAKHLAYHVLIALYFIWLPVFAILLGMAVNSAVLQTDFSMGGVLLLWMSLNLVIGTSLYFVIRLFEKHGMLYRFISYSYYFLALLSVTVVVLIVNRM